VEAFAGIIWVENDERFEQELAALEARVDLLKARSQVSAPTT
jgi:hypothetical protein